jgi:hypothetical protein
VNLGYYELWQLEKYGNIVPEPGAMFDKDGTQPDDEDLNWRT